MIPSRRSLQDGIAEHFRALEDLGIKNLKELLTLLGNKEKIARVAEESGRSEDYLGLLKREAASYLAKPFPLSDFPAIPLEYTEVLKTKGLKSTRQFFESVQLPEQKKKVARTTGIPISRLDEIFVLCDLSRITGVGAFYARIVYVAGLRSLKEFAETDVQTHARLYTETLKKLDYPIKAIGEEDLQYCISYARLIEELNIHRT